MPIAGGFGLSGARSPPEGQGSFFSRHSATPLGGDAADTASRDEGARPLSASKGPTSKALNAQPARNFAALQREDLLYLFSPLNPQSSSHTTPHNPLQRRFLLKSVS